MQGLRAWVGWRRNACRASAAAAAQPGGPEPQRGEEGTCAAGRGSSGGRQVRQSLGQAKRMSTREQGSEVKVTQWRV